jgi:hypothetical protein
MWDLQRLEYWNDGMMDSDASMKFKTFKLLNRCAPFKPFERFERLERLER